MFNISMFSSVRENELENCYVKYLMSILTPVKNVVFQIWKNNPILPNFVRYLGILLTELFSNSSVPPISENDNENETLCLLLHLTQAHSISIVALTFKRSSYSHGYIYIYIYPALREIWLFEQKFQPRNFGQL